MRLRFTRGVMLWALATTFFSLLAGAQERVLTPQQLEKLHAANGECFACHSEAALTKLPKDDLDVKKLRGLLQHPERYYTSDHQKLLCTKCHNEGYDEHPHAADAKDMTSTCADCHDKTASAVGKQFDRSVHARNLADTFTCTTCHDPHRMRVASKQKDPLRIVAQDNRICLGCHDSDAQFAKYAPEKKGRQPLDELHAWLPNARQHWQAVRCVECHTPEVKAGEMLSHQILSKDKAERECLTCHSANSSLKARLYRHLIKEEQERLGFANSVILASAYVPGATRHPLLDAMILGAFGLMSIGLLAHGLGRCLKRRKRESTAPNAKGSAASLGANADGQAREKTERTYLIAPWIRLWHAANALLILTLGVTGLSIHFADPTLPLVDFALAVRIHNTAGVLLIGAYLFFVVANVVTGNWWQFVPKPPGIFQRILTQARWYAIGVFRGEPHPHEPSPEEHFNALQAITYWSVMYLLLPVILVSGLIYLYPQFAPETLFGFDGLLPVALLHYLSAVAVLLFLLSHIYLGTTGKTVGQMFKMMITGWHEH